MYGSKNVGIYLTNMWHSTIKHTQTQHTYTISMGSLYTCAFYYRTKHIVYRWCFPAVFPWWLYMPKTKDSPQKKEGHLGWCTVGVRGIQRSAGWVCHRPVEGRDGRALYAKRQWKTLTMASVLIEEEHARDTGIHKKTKTRRNKLMSIFMFSQSLINFFM